MNHVYLIAEDDRDAQTLLKRAFLKAGLSAPVQFANDGVETLDYLRAKGKFSNRSEFPFPAILLLDHNMPRLNGLEVLKEIRLDESLKKLIVVMLSSSIDEDQIETAFSLGINSYVEKSCDFFELIRVARCIDDYWFGCNHFPNASHGIIHPHKKARTQDLS